MNSGCTTSDLLCFIIRELFVQNELPTWGLVVLLVAKAGGLKANFSNTERDISAGNINQNFLHYTHHFCLGILYSQRTLAEITEMIRKSIQIHKGILNFPPSTGGADLLNFGNKMALLSGDFLLSKSYRELANIRNQDVTEIISMGLRDLIDSEFVGVRDKQNNPLPAKPIKTIKAMSVNFDQYDNRLKADEVLGHWRGEWLLRNSLSGANLLGRACQGCFILAGHEETFHKEAFVFGKCFALALQSCLETKMLLQAKLDKNSLISLPLLFYLHKNPEAYMEIEKGLEDVKNIDYEGLHDEIMKTSGLDASREVQRELCDITLSKLDIFPEKSGRNVLSKIINALNVDF